MKRSLCTITTNGVSKASRESSGLRKTGKQHQRANTRLSLYAVSGMMMSHLPKNLMCEKLKLPFFAIGDQYDFI